MSTAERIEMVKLLQALRRGDEAPGATFLLAIKRARAAERERCALVCDGVPGSAAVYIAEIIRNLK